jgi:hypothetical protein
VVGAVEPSAERPAFGMSDPGPVQCLIRIELVEHPSHHIPTLFLLSKVSAKLDSPSSVPLRLSTSEESLVSKKDKNYTAVIVNTKGSPLALIIHILSDHLELRAK